MEYELIESLLADMALGNLSEESERLLGDYVASCGEYSELANGFDMAVSAAGRLSEDESELELPEFPVERVRAVVSSDRRIVFRMFKIAAVFVVGLTMMFMVSDGKHSNPGVSDNAVVSQDSIIVAEQPLIEQGSVRSLWYGKKIFMRYDVRPVDKGYKGRSIISRMKGSL